MRASRLWGLSYYGFFALSAAAQLILDYHAGLFLILNTAVGLASAMWLVWDAKYKGRFVPHIIQPAVMGFWIFVLPVYVIATRGWRGARLALLHGFLTFLVSGLVSFLIAFAFRS